MDYKELLYAVFYTINKPLGRNATQGIYNKWRERSKCTDTYLDPKQFTNVRTYILKSNRLTETEKDSIKEQVVANIQQNESVALEMNVVNDETDNTLKQSSNDCMKIQQLKMNITN